MFVHRLKVRLYHTDATGVIFFGHQFQLAMEALEEFLAARGFPWKALMASPYFFPVVHAEADYKQPLVVGDEIAVFFKVVKVGTSSVTLHYTLLQEQAQEEVGRVECVHVLVDQKTRRSVALPEAFRNLFAQELSDETCPPREERKGKPEWDV